MIKNWIIKTQQIKKKEQGFINHVNYLADKNRPSHFHSDIKILNNKSANILKTFDDRTLYRKKNGLRGGGVSNYATSFIMSIPRDIKQPSVDDWIKISRELIKDLAKTNNIDDTTMRDHIHIVLHDESCSDDKNSHLHVLVSNVINNEVVKSISQFKTTHAMKNSFNRSIKLVLDEDHLKYTPKQENLSKVPLWVSRTEKAKRMNAVIDDLKKTYKNIKSDITSWSKLFLSDLMNLKHITAKKAEKIAINLNALEQTSSSVSMQYDDLVEQIENLKSDASGDIKVSTKRHRRTRTRNR
ncbi:hypothetical protein MO387_16780 [Shewanella sp. N2AIL]|uniref:hypothetical protein n=1 Tax=Shewanella sp. N2AIL TaxID=2926851 RepID=UPI001F58EFEA|nr:hypothetical protein [Shewanella sp. N2AIL]MCI2964731.1 hypothetical protein [Shewanella sp. N2AIL]